MSTIADDDYFQSMSKELDSKLGRINSLIAGHPVEKGRYHEYILKDLIGNFLPRGYSVKTGFIYVDDEHISPQIDLMIIDEGQPPCILAQYDDFAIVYPEAVCCVIEVKTKLRKDDFADAVKKIKDIKELSNYNNPSSEMIGGLVFGFDSTRLTPRVLDLWYKSIATRPFYQYPEAILSHRHGLIQKWNIRKSNWGHYFVVGDSDELKWKSLSIFNSIIIKYCELKAGVSRPAGKTSFDRFSKIGGLMASAEYLRFGRGVV